MSARLLHLGAVLLLVTILAFGLIELLPGDAAEALLGERATPADLAALRAELRLDDPAPVRYLRWLGSMLRGDWGFSFASRVDVDALILQRLPTTLYVLGSAYVLALLIAIPVGVLSAVRPYSIFDQIATQ